MALAVADNVLLGQAVFFAQVGAKLHRLIVDLAKIGSVRQIVLTDFKGDMGIIAAALGAGAAMPAPVVPRKRLIGGDGSVGQLPDKGVDADLPPAGFLLIPVVVVLILPQKAVVRADIAFQIRVVGPGRMYHDPLRGNGAACLIAGIFRQYLFMQIHKKTSFGFRLKSNDAASAVSMHQSSAVIIKGQYFIVGNTVFCRPHTAHLRHTHAVARLLGRFRTKGFVPRVGGFAGWYPLTFSGKIILPCRIW